MKRLRHIRHFAALQEAQKEAQKVNDTQQPLPIALMRFLRHWDILGIAKFDDLAYEDAVVFLIHHLPEAPDLNDVERLLFQYFADQTGSDQFTVEVCLLIKLLADDIYEIWRDYLARNTDWWNVQEAHARARMKRFAYPRSNSR